MSPAPADSDPEGAIATHVIGPGSVCPEWTTSSQPANGFRNLNVEERALIPFAVEEKSLEEGKKKGGDD